MRAVQVIHLAPDGEKVARDEQARRHLPAAKPTYGVMKGAAGGLPGDPTGPLLLAEGPETGLAVYAATGHEIWVALGSVAKLEPPIGRRVVVVADDNPPATDAKHGGAAKALRDAVRDWRRQGVDVVVITPWPVRRFDKSDFADLTLADRAEAVLARIRTGTAAPAPGPPPVQVVPTGPHYALPPCRFSANGQRTEYSSAPGRGRRRLGKTQAFIAEYLRRPSLWKRNIEVYVRDLDLAVKFAAAVAEAVLNIQPASDGSHPDIIIQGRDANGMCHPNRKKV